MTMGLVAGAGNGAVGTADGAGGAAATRWIAFDASGSARGGAMAGADGRGAANGAALRTGTIGAGACAGAAKACAGDGGDGAKAAGGGDGVAGSPCAGEPCDAWKPCGDDEPLRLWSAAWKLCGGGAEGDLARDAGNAGAAPRTGMVRAGAMGTCSTGGAAAWLAFGGDDDDDGTRAG